MSDNQVNYLKTLGDSKYEIVAGESDIRGWTVKNDFGRILGRVNDLILDTKSQKIKYFILDTEGNELYLMSRKVLLPLDHSELDEVYKNVIFSGLMANELSSLPTFDKNNLGSKSEEIIYTTFKNFPPSKSERTSYSNDVVSREEREASTVRDSDYETQYTDQYENEAVRHQSVAAVFETRDHADLAIARLIENGFHRRDITISFRDEHEIARGDIHENDSISGFFSNFFSAEEADWLRSDDARKYPVVIVNKLSIAEAERAAEILDRFGALDIDESLKLYQSQRQLEKGRRSRIIDN